MPNFLFYVLAGVNVIYMLHIGLYTIGANAYDIVKFKRIHDARIKNGRAGNKSVPAPKLVSVVIPAHNEEKAIRRTLDSVLASSYSNIEVIVVDDGSSDRTLQMVRAYIKRIKSHKKLQLWSYFDRDLFARASKVRRITVSRSACRIRVIHQRNQGKAEALNNAIRNNVRGELVMTLDADSLLHPAAIERATGYFKDRRVIGVAANVRIMENHTILGKLQRFEHMIGYRSKKAFAVSNSEFIIGGVASTYRRSILKKVRFYDNDTMTEDIGLSMKIISQLGNRNKRITYAADVVAVTEGVLNFRDLRLQRYRWKMGNLQNLYKHRGLVGHYEPRKLSRMLTIYRLPMAILSELLLIIEPVLIAYILYISVEYHSLTIIAGAYATITFYTLSVLWPDEHLRLKDKLKLSLTALWIYPVFYVMDIVQLYAMVKAVKRRKQIYRPEKAYSTWTSPKRASEAARA